MLVKKDCYKILGLKRQASQDEIDKAYRKITMRHHPALDPSRASEIQKILNDAKEAYEALSQKDEFIMFDFNELPSAMNDLKDIFRQHAMNVRHIPSNIEIANGVFRQEHGFWGSLKMSPERRRAEEALSQYSGTAQYTQIHASFNDITSIIKNEYIEHDSNLYRDMLDRISCLQTMIAQRDNAIFNALNTLRGGPCASLQSLK